MWKCLCTQPEEVGGVGWVGEKNPELGLGVPVMSVLGQRKQNSGSRSCGKIKMGPGQDTPPQ